MPGGVGSTSDGTYRSEANRLGLDYRAEASILGPPPVPITDAHAHINGARAARVWAGAADLYGVERVYSMTRVEDAAAVREALGDRVRFIAFPSWGSKNRQSVHRAEYVDVIRRFREEFDARIVKFWSAPALRDFAEGDPADLVGFDSPWRLRQAELAADLGMMFMVHVADPDTWFGAKYTDEVKYGTKASQYESFERMLERFPVPWIAAHMGGWPEHLDFLDGLLERHDNLCLDTSATKWVVRELGAHPEERVRRFFERWRGRLLFGSDIVTMDAHLSTEKPDGPGVKAHQASNEADAFDLYASRYWTLRTMFETSHVGESPIVDPDLAMRDPGRYDDRSAPTLRGVSLPPDVMRSLYHDAAQSVVERWCAR